MLSKEENMDQKYVVRTDNVITKPMSRSEAIKTVKEYDKKGISAYILSEDEGKRIEKSEFHKPTWE